MESITHNPHSQDAVERPDPFRQSGIWFKELFQRSRDAYLLLDQNSVIDCNQATLRLMRMDKAELVGCNPWDFSPAEQRDGQPSCDRFRDYKAQALESGSHCFEWRFNRKNSDDALPVEITLTALPDPEGRLFHALLRDMTAQRQMEEVLARREAVLEAVIYASERFLHAESWELCIRDVLERLGRSIQASQAYLVGQWELDNTSWNNCPGFIWVDDQMEKKCAILFDTGLFTRWEPILRQHESLQLHTRDFSNMDRERLERLQIKSVLLVPVFVEDECWGYLGFHHALEERQWTVIERDALEMAADMMGNTIAFKLNEKALRESQKSLHKLNDELEERVRQRTHALHDEIRERRQAQSVNEQLIQELETKNSEMERFVYTVSHDLKSPLVTVKGFIQVLKKDIAEKKLGSIDDSLDQILFAANKMHQLLDDLLNLSRASTTVITEHEVPFDEVVEEALKLLEGRIKQHNVKIDVASGMPGIIGDRQRLVQLVQNLVDNAVKFMGNQQHPHVAVGCEIEGDEPIFFVEDNGRGIPPKKREEIFDVFHKLEPASEGSGVGLAIVKRIIDQHGGRIWIESKPKHPGVTFKFMI